MGEYKQPAPRFGSLFSGIGGLDLGLERAGWEVAWQSEINPFASQVLAKHWPNVPNLGDVTKIEWETVERVDLICGGYPCQPFSYAGTRGGADDPRHLWPHMLDAIRVLRPGYVLIENVPGHLSLGFERVLADLAGVGFDAEWSIVPACALGASHARERLFCVAYAANGYESDYVPSRRVETGDDADTDERIARFRWLESRGSGGAEGRDGWLPEPAVDRVAHGVPSSVVRAPLEALGNAVVPQVAEWIGTQILRAVEDAA